MTQDAEESVALGLKGNEINDLTAREHTLFLHSVEKMPRTTKEDVDFSIKHGTVTQSALSETLLFFTKKGESVLDVFSGHGRMLTACTHTEREVEAIDFDPQAKEAYEAEIAQDMFAAPVPYHVGDAIEELRRMHQEGRKFEFIFMDPPRCKPSCKGRRESPKDLKPLHLSNYADYITEAVKAAVDLLHEERFVAVQVDDTFHKGALYHTPGQVTERLRTVDGMRLRLMKMWHYPRHSGVGNLGLTVPIINVSYMLVYQKFNG